MKTENLDFLAAVRLLDKKGGHIRRASRPKTIYAFNTSGRLDVYNEDWQEFNLAWRLGAIFREDALANDWEHVCED